MNKTSNNVIRLDDYRKPKARAVVTINPLAPAFTFWAATFAAWSAVMAAWGTR